MEKVTQSYYKMMDDLVKRDMTGIFEIWNRQREYLSTEAALLKQGRQVR